MGQTINLSQFRDAFATRNAFTYSGLALLFKYLADCDPDYELDVIDLCCTYQEETLEQAAKTLDLDTENLDDYELSLEVVKTLKLLTYVVGATSTTVVYAQY